MTTFDPLVLETERALHVNCPQTCPGSRSHERDAVRVVAVVTTPNTAWRISQAHSLGIRAGRYAEQKEKERALAVADSALKEVDRLRDRVEFLQKRR